MTEASAEAAFRQTGWPGLRAKLFHLYFVLRRPMTLGVRGLIHDRAANTVFLIRHTYVPGWQLPGGGVERGETMEEALTREIFEEANITLTAPPQLRSVHLNRRSSPRVSSSTLPRRAAWPSSKKPLAMKGAVARAVETPISATSPRTRR